MKLTQEKLQSIIRDELINERRKVAMGEDGGHVRLQKFNEFVLMDIKEAGARGEYRVKLAPGEVQNLINNLQNMV